MQLRTLLLASLIAASAVSSAHGQELTPSRAQEIGLRSFQRSLERVQGDGLEPLLKSLVTTIRSYALDRSQLAKYGLGRFGSLFRGADFLEVNPSEGILERSSSTMAWFNYQGRRQLVRIQPIVTWRFVKGVLELQGIAPAPGSGPKVFSEGGSDSFRRSGIVPALTEKMLGEDVVPRRRLSQPNPASEATRGSTVADANPEDLAEKARGVLVYEGRSTSSPVLYQIQARELRELGSLGAWRRVTSRLGSGWIQAKVGGSKDQPATPSAPPGASARDLEVLARIVKGETNLGVPRAGRVAVAAVVLNRVRDRRWPNSTPGVAHEPLQFSCYNRRYRAKLYDGQIPDWAFEAAKAALRGEDPTRGATHYFNPFIVLPPWARKLKFIRRIGTNRSNAHDFYK
tara:strand:- start:3653 stop:4852 length:1200 start_codon:yes stop_codon:yes gene_type:complete